MDRLEMARQLRKALEMYVADLPDEKAVTVSSVAQPWAVGEAVTPGMRRYYDPTGRLYKCVQAHTTQADWTPDKTPALWAVVDAAHAGTQDDPIPAARGMEYIYGKYYSDPEDGKVYLCTRQGTSPGQTVTLQYLPHELIGQYFAAA